MKLFTLKEIKTEQQTHLDEILRKESVVSGALKAHEAKMNVMTEQYQKKREEKEKELREVEFRIKTAIGAGLKSVEALEERRLEALKPIEKEKQEVEELIRKNLEITKAIALERKALEAEISALGNKEYELESKRRAFEATQSDILNLVAQRQRDAEAAIEMARVMQPVFDESRKRSEEAAKDAQFRMESAEKAEKIAKAAMLAADNKVAQEKEEQQKTDEKRKMLGVAIRELKQRGLWQKQLETAIK